MYVGVVGGRLGEADLIAQSEDRERGFRRQNKKLKG